MYSNCAIRLRLGKILVPRCAPRIYLRPPLGNLARNGPQNIIQTRGLLSTQATKHTAPSALVENSTRKTPVRIRKRPNAKHRSKSLVKHTSKHTSKRSSKLRVQPKKVQHKKVQPKLAAPELTKPVLQTSAQKLAYFQEKLIKIRANMHNQVTNLELAAKFLDVQKDRLHPVVHCQHILVLNTTSNLQGLLQAIADKTPKESKHPTQEDSTAIWLESRVLAVQLWIIKRLLRMQLLEIRDKDKWAQAQTTLQGVEAQVFEMNSELAVLRDIFHRIRPERSEGSLSEGWAKNFFVKELEDTSLDDTSLTSATRSLQPSPSQRNHIGTPVHHPALLENLAIVAAYSRQESAIWKIERFLSRIEEVYRRVPKVISRLNQLASELQVTENRSHPLVSTVHLLELNTFGSLDMVLRVLRKRTPKNRLKLERGMGEALWLDSRIPEVQLEVAKMRLWAYHQTTKSQNLLPHQKSLIRSIRGRIKVAHTLLQNSRKEFGSYGPQGQFEAGGEATTENKTST